MLEVTALLANMRYYVDIVSDHSDVLRQVYAKLSQQLNAQSVARNMFQCCSAITLKELQSIQSKHSEPIKAAERLLNIVMNQSDNGFSCFLAVLKETGHQHVYEVIVASSYSGKCYAIAVIFIVLLFTF